MPRRALGQQSLPLQHSACRRGAREQLPAGESANEADDQTHDEGQQCEHRSPLVSSVSLRAAAKPASSAGHLLRQRGCAGRRPAYSPLLAAMATGQGSDSCTRRPGVPKAPGSLDVVFPSWSAARMQPDQGCHPPPRRRGRHPTFLRAGRTPSRSQARSQAPGSLYSQPFTSRRPEPRGIGSEADRASAWRSSGLGPAPWR